jgi:hypothetical protein
MKISTHLPQFKSPHLLISAGKQEGAFYLADENEITLIDNIKLEKPQYTDREGRFLKSGLGRVFGSGSVYESKDDETTRAFVKKLTERTTHLVFENHIKHIYLFCPTYLANQMEAGLTRDLQDMITYIFFGNYHNQHPFVLLAKIQEYQKVEDRTVTPIKNEAMNILKKTGAT